MRYFAKASAAVLLTVLATTGCTVEASPDASYTTDSAWKDAKQAWSKAKRQAEKDLKSVETEAGDSITYDSTYDREAFGNDWADVDENGCGTRDDILARDLENLVVDGDDCTVLFGTLYDPYTGTAIEFERGASRVDIDHLFPLSAAWSAGAKNWTDGLRLQFANDPENLYASSAFNIEVGCGISDTECVELEGNRAKGDSTLSEWMPSNVGFHCEYATQYMTVARKYNLRISDADARVAAQAC